MFETRILFVTIVEFDSRTRDLFRKYLENQEEPVYHVEGVNQATRAYHFFRMNQGQSL